MKSMLVATALLAVVCLAAGDALALGGTGEHIYPADKLMHFDSVAVPASSTHGVTCQTLARGVVYVMEVSGTVGFDSGSDRADAEFVQLQGDWRERYAPSGYSFDAMDLLVNGVEVHWEGTRDGGKTWETHTFSPTHVYRSVVIGDGSPASFRFSDGAGMFRYRDNDASFTVTVYRVLD